MSAASETSKIRDKEQKMNAIEPGTQVRVIIEAAHPEWNNA